MDNVETLLGEAGARLEDICKLVVYLTDSRYREAVYRVMGERAARRVPRLDRRRRQRPGAARVAGRDRRHRRHPARRAPRRQPRRARAGALWVHFRDLRQFARPPRGEAAALAHLARLGVAPSAPGGAGRRRQPARPGARHERAGEARRPSSCRPISTWSASGTQRAPTTPRGPDPASCSRATGSRLMARRSAPTTASASPPCRPSPRATPPHGPLEFLFTTAEEVGLEGAARSTRAPSRAAAAQPGRPRGRRAHRRLCRRHRHRHPPGEAADRARSAEAALRVEARGATGGHSGLDIAVGKANAVKVLARCLREACEEHPFRLALLQDGGKPQRHPARGAGRRARARGKRPRRCARRWPRPRERPPRPTP